MPGLTLPFKDAVGGVVDELWDIFDVSSNPALILLNKDFELVTNGHIVFDSNLTRGFATLYEIMKST